MSFSQIEIPCTFACLPQPNFPNKQPHAPYARVQRESDPSRLQFVTVHTRIIRGYGRTWRKVLGTFLFVRGWRRLHRLSCSWSSSGLLPRKLHGAAFPYELQHHRHTPSSPRHKQRRRQQQPQPPKQQIRPKKLSKKLKPEKSRPKAKIQTNSRPPNERFMSCLTQHL